MRKVRVKMQDLQIGDVIGNGTMQEEDMDTDAITSAPIKDTATNAPAKTAHFLLLGLMPNEASKHEADATIAVVKIKKDGVAIATAEGTNEDKAAAATVKLLRGRHKENGLAAEDDDVNNNEVGAAAAAIELPKRLEVEDEYTPTAIGAGNLTSGKPGLVDLKWTASYPKRWQNPPPLADLSKPSHPFHEVWQKWNPDHKPNRSRRQKRKNIAVQMDMN